MPQRLTTGYFSRKKEQQLWLILLTTIMATNAFLLLFFHTPFPSPGFLSEEHFYSLTPQNPAFNIHHDHPDAKRTPPLMFRGADIGLEDVLRPAENPEQIREKFVDKRHDDASNSRDRDLKPQLKQAVPSDLDNKQALPRPQLVETVGDKIPGGTMNMAENMMTKKLLKPGDVVPQLHVKSLTQRPDSKVTTLNPWLYKPDNMTRLEQVIHSLQVVTDDDRDFIMQSSYFQPRDSIMTSFIPKVLIDSVHCPAHGPRLLIVIPSVWVNFKARQAIRDTWASPAYGGDWPGDPRNLTSLLKVVFFLGNKTPKIPPALVDEAQKFQDIVQLDFQDSYFNLSLKMSLALEWSTNRCKGASYVMKVDEDTFMEVSLVLDLLQNLSDHTSFVLGFHHHIEKPPVLRNGKWEVPRSLYPLSHFPRYLLGHSYLFSFEAVIKVRKVWRYMPLVPNEDAFLTGILAKVTSVTRIHCPWFARENRKGDVIPREELANGRSVSQTGFKPFKKLFSMWEMVKKAFGDDLKDIPNLYS